jgi:hypothetical protein
LIFKNYLVEKRKCHTTCCQHFVYWFSKLSSTKWWHTKESEIPGCKSNNVPLEAFAATEFSEVCSGRQPRRDVKLFPVFSVCCGWWNQPNRLVRKSTGGNTETQTDSGQWERYIEMCSVQLYLE